MTQNWKQHSVFDMTYWQNMHVHARLFLSPLQTSQFLSFAATSFPAELMSHQVVLARVNKRKKNLTNIDWENIYNSCKKQFKQFPATNISKPCLHPVSSVILQCSYKQKARIILLPNTINYFSIAADNSKPTTKTKPLQYCTQQQPKENYSSTAPSTANQQLERYAQRNTSPTGAHA